MNSPATNQVRLLGNKILFRDMGGIITFDNITDAKLFMTGSYDQGFDVTKIEIKVYTRRRKLS